MPVNAAESYVRIDPMILPRAFDELKQRWPTEPVYGLTALLASLDRPSISQRVELARACHDTPHAHERMKAALGRIGGNKDVYLSLWCEMGYDPTLIAAALDCGLHLHYHTPDESGELFEAWVGNGSEMGHRCAVLAWERAISGFTRPHLLDKMLDPDVFTQLHMETWGERIAKTWEFMPLDQRMPVMIKFLARSSHNRQTGNPWCEKWTSIFLDEAACTPEMVSKCLDLSARDESNPCLRRLEVYQQVRQLENETPVAPSRASMRRM